MKKNLLKLLIASIASTVLIVSFHQQSLAQEALRTFTISPPTVEVNLAPGDHKEGTIKIINDSTEALTFTTTIQDFVVKDNTGTPYILPPDTLSNKYSGASWIGISPTVVTIEPHQKAELSYFIQVPTNARPGGHYAAIVYTPTNALGVNGTGTSVNTSIGTLFYTTIKGKVNEQANVTSFTSKGFYEYGPSNITTEIINLSDIHIQPRGSIILTNMLGGRSAYQPLTTLNIFPGVSRAYQNKLGHGFMIGFYKAKLSATYGSSNLPLSATVSFLVFPWRITLFILLLVVALVVGYYYWKRRGNTPNSPPTPPVSNV